MSGSSPRRGRLTATMGPAAIARHLGRPQAELLYQHAAMFLL
jgi:hypothetical protein